MVLVTAVAKVRLEASMRVARGVASLAIVKSECSALDALNGQRI